MDDKKINSNEENIEELDFLDDDINSMDDDNYSTISPESVNTSRKNTSNTVNAVSRGNSSGSLMNNRNIDYPKMGNFRNNDNEMLKKRMQHGQHQNLSRINAMNRNKASEEGSVGIKNSAQEQAVQKGLSTAAQAHGIPKPVADIAANKLAGPMLNKMKKTKQATIIALLVPIFIILVPILVAGSDEDFQDSDSENRSEYLYGSGSEDSLYKYLEETGLCEDVENCSSTDAAKFYKQLKSVLSSNQYLTPKHADSFIIKMILYERDKEEAYKHVDEIQYIANIIGKNETFDISKADKYKEEFVKENGYFDTYRKDDLLNTNSTIQYKEKLYDEIVRNSENFVYKLEEVKKEENNRPQVCEYNVNGNNVSNIKVRLLQCSDGQEYQPIEGTELIDFEKYILGVVYAENENGATESIKAQAIAARSLALSIGENKGESLSLRKENGQWILPIRNCNQDQVYCDPDKGCWSNSATADATVHSGYDSNKAYSKAPLAQSSSIRTIVAETAGKVLVDSNEKILYTEYSQAQKDIWNNGAVAGNDHFELLKGTYSTSAKILSTCTSNSINGEYSSWKQYQGSWIGIPLGYSKYTIKSAGCLVTSVAIQIARSGTQITVDNFDPGVFVKHLNLHNGFTPGGNFYWAKPSSSGIAPNFIYQGKKTLTGTASDKAQQIKSLEDQGYYIVIYIQNNAGGTHWVALDHVQGSNVYMFDPGSSSTNLWDKYPVNYVKEIAYYEKTDK